MSLIEHRLTWFGHIERKYAEDMTRRLADRVVEGERRRPRKTWKELVREDLKKPNLIRYLAQNRNE